VHGAGANVVFDRYDGGSEWAPLSFTGASALTSIAEHSAVWTGRSYFVIGGTAAGSMTYYSEAYEVDPLLGTTMLASGSGASTLPREDAAVVWTGNEAWVFGGFDRRDTAAIGDAFAWDPATRTWRTLPSSGAPGARAGAASVWTGGAWIIWGGYDGSSMVFANGFRLISG
jgi:N-acetylneuraminic acid mutarotase